MWYDTNEHNQILVEVMPGKLILCMAMWSKVMLTIVMQGNAVGDNAT